MRNVDTKMKVVWICHFTNAEIQSILKPYRKINEFASWIPEQAAMFEGDERFDLYIISPHEYITGIRKIKLRGINYIFYNAHMPIIGRHWPGCFRWDYISNFFTSKQVVKHLVGKINPDVIHLQTAENAYVSSTILPLIGKYPIISGVQGFISQAKSNNSLIQRKKVQVEKEIFCKLDFAFYRTEKMKTDLLEFNSILKLFPTSYPVSTLDRKDYEFERVNEFDIVFFARISREKGIFDLLDAISILNNQGKKYSLCIIGGGNRIEVMNYAKEKSIENLITWKGFLLKQEDVYREVVKCRISVLPTHFDIIPGTIIQSMLLKLPVVSYNVGSIPQINIEKEYIKIVEKQDIYALTTEIDGLLSMEEKDREKYAEKARQRAIEMFVQGRTDEEIKKSLLIGYNAAISGFLKQ